MRRTATMATSVVLIALLAALGGCGRANDAPTGHPSHERPPEAVGTVTEVIQGIDSVLVGFAPDAGYGYYEGTVFDLDSGTGLIDAEGQHLDPGTLTPGDRIEVWTDMCAESFPVQCVNPQARLID